MMDETGPPTYDESQEQFSAPIAICPGASFDNEGFQENEGFIKPPTAPPCDYPTQERLPVVDLGSLSADEIREACLDYVSEHCCYGSRFVRKTELPEIQNICTYHYQLETYGEKRETHQRTEPFRGQPIDGPENGPPPEPWSMAVPFAAPFVDGQSKVEIPHTAYVGECGRCFGSGKVRCKSCNGRGNVEKLRELRRRREEGKRLVHELFWEWKTKMLLVQREWKSEMQNLRWKRTTEAFYIAHCHMDVSVHRCQTFGTDTVHLDDGKSLYFLWGTNHIESYITDTSKMPKILILEASGREIFKEQNPKVQPINHAPDETVNLASHQMIAKHETGFLHELIRMQRHTLRAVPLTKALYSWKRKQGELYVYGFQKKVYFENYPQKCCCCTCC